CSARRAIATRSGNAISYSTSGSWTPIFMLIARTVPSPVADTSDQALHRVELASERRPALPGEGHPGPRPALLEHLVDLDQARLLEHLEVAAEVAVGEVEHPLQVR